MGILSWFLNEPSRTPKSTFVFADGNRLTPRDFGYGLLRFSHEPARELFESCFGEGGPGPLLPGGALIAANPFVAHLYLTALYVGSYLAYVRFVLKVSDVVLGEVDGGLSRGLNEILAPDGSVFGSTDQQNLRAVIDLFAQAVVDDIQKSDETDPDVFDPTPSNAAKVAISVLDGAYRDDDGAMYLVSDAPMLLPHFLRLQTHLANAPLTVLTLLTKQMKVRLVSAG
ncbi:hypothetical protein OKW30_008390 [Paraburkholderia sp. Clong3]|uniref:hypothetical protein n=1 Tax=Paraburkholderia sp. Clong3 TaxID=2991061 RepID=UPI003D25B04C